MSYYIIVKATGLIKSDGPNSTRAYNTIGAAKAMLNVNQKTTAGPN